MKKRKLILPSIALALVAAFGLAACGGNNGGGESSAVSLGTITITAAENKVDLVVGDTVQLTASVDGVTWKSRSTAVATVSDTGLVTAVGAGTVKIRAEKDNYETGSITINVTKAPERAAHTTIDLEHCDHYSPTDIWGMDLSAYGYGFMGPGDTPLEDNNGATPDSHSLGYLQQGCKETLTFTSNKAAEVEIGVTMAYASEMNLASALSVTFNGAAIDMTGKVCEGPEDGNSSNYYDFHVVSFGKVNLIQGNNVLEIEMIAQGPNMDEFKLYSDDTSLVITVVEPVAKPKIEVTPTEATIEVGDTVQLNTATAGVTFTSSSEAIATVSETGLVTGVAMGKATITVEKEGMKKATAEITVKAKPVAGQIVLEAEEGELGGSARVENDNSSSGGARVGYLSADTSLTLKTTLEEAGEYEVSMLAYSNNVSDWTTYPNVTADELDLSSCMTFKVNSTDVSLTGKVLPGGAWGTWVELSFGKFNLVKGENTFEFAFTAQGPNIDCVKLTDSNAQVTPPEVIDLTSAFYLECEDGKLSGQARAEANASAHGGNTVGYMAAGASITLEFNASAAGQVRLVLLGHTASADWSQYPNVIYNDHALEGTTTIKVNDVEVDLTGKTFLAADGNTVTQIDLGQVAVQSGKNTIAVNALQQAPNFDAFAILSGSIEISIPQEEIPEGMIYLEAEDGALTGNASVESKASAHGKKSVGNFSADSSLTLTFNASAAGTVELFLVGATCNMDYSDWSNMKMLDHDLAACLSITINGEAIDLTGKTLPGCTGMNFENWAEISLGQIAVQSGTNTIVVTSSAQGPNFDMFKVQGNASCVVSLPQA